MLWLRYVALPDADQYRDRIVATLEKSTGLKVGVRSIHGGWGGLRPQVSLEGFELSDHDGKVVVAFESAQVTLSWWALARGELRFHDVDVNRPLLALRRGADGLIYLADKPLNAKTAQSDDRLARWLLGQPRLVVHDAVLLWRDETTGAPEVRLANVQIAIRQQRGRHRIAFSATPPRALAARIDVRGDLGIARRGDKWSATGELYAETRDADLARLRTYVPMPDTVREAAGNVRIWATLGDEGVRSVVADLNMRDVHARLADDASALTLAAVSGRAAYTAKPGGYAFTTEGLRFRMAGGPEAQAGRFALSRTAPAGAPPHVELNADGIDLQVAATLLEYFPLAREMRAQIARFAPRGHITLAQLTWTGDDAQHLKDYALKGRFEGLAVNAVDAWPGVSGVSGSIEGTQAGGEVRLESKNVSFDLPVMFRAPLAFDKVQARASWKHVGPRLEVGIEELAFANADGEGHVAGAWHSTPAAHERNPGFVDLKGTISRADARRVASYLPNRMALTRDWLERAVQAGTATRVRFEVRGDLWQFPFGREDSDGHFLVEGDVRDGVLKYHPDWPSVDAIQGTIRFENRRMEIRAERAAIFASRASPVVAVIEELGAKPTVVRIDGDIDTSGADTVRFLRESPLVNGPGAFTRAVSVEGPGRLKLHLEYTLGGGEPVRVAGDYQFAGATASVGHNLAMRDVRGRLDFTERGVRAPDLGGTFFGKPAKLAIATQADGQVLTTIDGRIDAAAMVAYVPEAIAPRLAGETGWHASLTSGRSGSELSVTSDLQGLAVSLPAPLAKSEADARPLALTIARLGAEGEVTTASLEGGIHGRFNRVSSGGSERWQVAVKLGTPVASEPMRDGLWLYGEAPDLDVDAWQAVFAAPHADPDAPAPAAAEGGLQLRGVDLALARARYMGRDFALMRARLERSASDWSGTLESPRMAGDIRWNWEGKGRLVARLDRLTLAEAAKSEAPESPAAAPAHAQDLPALDVTAERFEFRGHWLGRLDLKAEPAGDEWRIDKLDIVNGHAQLKSTGGWRRTATGSVTTLVLSLDAENLNALFAQFGYGDYLKRGAGKLEGTLVWPGYPYEFSLATLAGGFKVGARNGQFAKIEAGAGKLLGLLSLQSLPRRASFDFSDIFSEGFAFERINGEVRIARGILRTDAFEISGPAAFVNLSGEVSLPGETQALTMQVIPEVSESVALAATVIGTPVLGLSTLLVSKLLKNPFGKAVAYEYQVTGSWDNPQVTRTSAPPAKAAAASPPQDAAKASTLP